jgi:hypothetical protein
VPFVSSEQNTQYYEPVAIGPVAQADMSSSPQLGAVPTTIAASGNWTSPVISSDGFKIVAAGVQLSVTGGSIQINRYVDKAGLVPVPGTVTATALTTTAGSYVTPNDGAPFQSFTVKITAPASAVNVSNFVLLLNAQ